MTDWYLAGNERKSSVVSYDASTTAWINAVVAAGGAVSTTQKGRIDALIVALKGHGLFSTNSRLWLYGGESDHKQATIDIMGLAVATEQGSPTFGAGGYTGNGSSMYLDLGTLPSDYTRDSATYGVYVLNNPAGDNSVSIGAFDGGSTFADLLTRQAAGNSVVRINDGGGNSLTPTNSTRLGLYINTRTDVSTHTQYKNGSQTATATGVGSAVITSLPGFAVLGRNDNGTVGSFSVEQIAAAYIMGAMDATQASNFSTDLNAYMTAWEINEY